jgi:hypothetical protein
VLFHPRFDRWDDHFVIRGPIVTGTTPKGRATVFALGMNVPDQVLVRIELTEAGLWPS